MYEEQSNEEAKFAKTLDKLQALAQNSDGRLRNEEWITQEKSRAHNKKVMGYSQQTASIFERYYEKAIKEGLFPENE